MYKSHRRRFIRISWIKYSSIKPLIVGHSFKRLWYVTHLHWNLKLNLKHRRVVKWFRDAEIVRFYTADKSIFSFGCFIWGERKKGLGGTWELSRRYKVFLLCLAHMRRSWMSENHSFPSLMRFWTLNNSVTIAQIEKLGQNTLPVCFFLSYWKIFTECEGRKHLDLSQWVQSESLFRIFSTFHTHGALSHVEAQLRTRRWWVSGLKPIPFSHNVTHLICELEARIVKTFHSFSISAKDYFWIYFLN